MAWLTEDWGTTLGTAGALAWGQWDVSGVFGTVAFWTVPVGNGTDYDYTNRIDGGTVSGTIYSFPSAGTWGNKAATPITTSYGTLTGSQYHVGSVSGLSSGDISRFVFRAASYGGTELLAVTQFLSSSSRCYWYTVIGSTWTERTSGTGAYSLTGDGNIAMSTVYGTGTWTFTVTDDVHGTFSATYGAGTDYNPATIALPGIAAINYKAVTTLLESRYEYTPNPSDSILYFVGTWKDGSSGTYQWGNHVLGAPSNVCDRAHYPGENRGWASTVNVTLDDSAGQWTGFAGGTAGTTVYQGTWTLQQWFAGLGTEGALGSWVRLFTGVLEPENVSYNYADRSVQITLQSVIGRLAETRAKWNGSRLNPDRPVEEICEISTNDYEVAGVSGGTVYLSMARWLVEDGCYIWGSSDYGANGTKAENARIGSSITEPGSYPSDGTGTFYIAGDLPEWCNAAGDKIYITWPWPDYDHREQWTGSAAGYVRVLGHNLGVGTGDATDWVIFNKQAGKSRVSPGLRLYGGEKVTDALNGVMLAIGGFYSVDPLGQFRARCLLPTYIAAGTIAFASAFDSQWVAEHEQALQSVDIDCSWSERLGSYQQHVRAGGTVGYGKSQDYDMKWLGSNIEAESLAARLWRQSYTPRTALRLKYAGSSWPNVVPGDAYAVHGLPAHLGSLVTGTTMICYSRTYDYDSDLVELELTAIPQGNWAYWNNSPADEWDASGKVWY